jgi:hypothetical protein
VKHGESVAALANLCSVRAMRELIPSPVFDSIRTHLRTVAEGAVTGWEANQDEEDSLTGDLGRLLKTPRTVQINLNGQIWRWCVGYKKFRGRGDGAFEARSGADGIIQIEATLRDVTFFKGILFQAKKATRFRTPRQSSALHSQDCVLFPSFITILQLHRANS